MMTSIEEALTQKKELVIEASTGMGKTIGYLLPAVNFALDTGKQVLISTYTTHQQDQLVLKEGKMVEEFIGAPVRISLIKGVSHYIDLARFVELLQGDDESYDETFTIMQVLVWLTATETGDLNEINASSGGQFVLDKIRRSHIRKLSKQEKQADFYEFALKQAQHAHVIVTNHAFLLNQHLSKKSILANVDAYIWDEAHQVVQAAVSQHEKTFVYTQWKYIFGQIGSLDEKQLAASLFETAQRTGFSTVPEMMKLESLFLRFTALFDEISTFVANEFAANFAASRHKKIRHS
ncbi:DinG family ATP-dependent helicase YoaA [Planococcus halocryophilus Or1]|uniref:DEAD/DEAH box helicase n=1 Tax=Planococcus halocryophilus TaxID=1215089 RepID=UPI0002B8921D|nr:DEAD/DEAH box helicase [Planococcus halocryophilus]EMF46177.1 DinG family ATP-dependent helicase YoaA [Planococcus halocryophilus Or1]